MPHQIFHSYGLSGTTVAEQCVSMQKALDRYLIPDARQMAQELTEATGPSFYKLNRAVSPCLAQQSN